MSESNLKLSNQLCFPLYVCSKEIISKYKEFLDKIDLTYTQYVVMLALWEQGSTNVRQLGNIICLDSGTLTPLLKKLEKKGLITRTKDPSDERNLIIDVTKDGYKLKDKVKNIPNKVSQCLPLSDEEKVIFGEMLHKIVKCIYDHKDNKNTSSKN